jgi:hypothetical protein
MLVGVLACSKTKALEPRPAVELYQGRTFRAAVEVLRAKGCGAYLMLPGDESVVIAEAICERWETGNDRDLCPECAKKAGLG